MFVKLQYRYMSLMQSKSESPSLSMTLNINPGFKFWQNMKSLWLMLWMHEHYRDRKMNNQPITVYLWSCRHKNLTNNKWPTSSLVDVISTYNSIKVNPTLHTPSSASYFFFCGDVSVLFLFSWEKRKEKFNNVYKDQKNFFLICFFLGGGGVKLYN